MQTKEKHPARKHRARYGARVMAGVTIASLVLAGACSLLGLKSSKDNDKRRQTLLLLLLASLAPKASGSSGCQNQSGLVICIPPGVRQ